MKIEIETSAYQFSYGHSPRGRGSWAFCPSNKYNSGDYLAHTFWTPGSTIYGEARKLAVAHFKALGISQITVCT